MNDLGSIIQWKWPGALIVIRGNILDRWEGPGSQPSDIEIQQAITEYISLGIEKEEQSKETDNNKIIKALAQLDFEERQKLQIKPGQVLRTAQECKDRIRAIYKGSL